MRRSFPRITCRRLTADAWRRALVAAPILLLCGQLVGCTIDRSSLTMSTGQTMPWLNLELAPKKKEIPPPRSISRSPKVPTDQLNVELAVEEPKRETRLVEWLTPAPKQGRPLPLTETKTATARNDGSITPEAIEF